MTPKSRAPATGYITTAAQGGNPRMTEGWALIEAARRMAESITMEGDEFERKEAMKKAARLNWRLWTIFQSEMTVDENDVPFEIRINMLTLCKFIDKHMVQVLAGPTPELLVTMIDINRNIAAGLMELQRRLVTRLARNPRKDAGDRFRPHLTLCRFRAATRIPPLATPLDMPSFPVATIALVRSTLLGPGGAHHETVRAVSLSRLSP